MNKPLVGIDENLARRAGVIEGVHYASNEKPQLGPADALITATGLQFNEAVVSTDEDEPVRASEESLTIAPEKYG